MLVYQRVSGLFNMKYIMREGIPLENDVPKLFFCFSNNGILISNGGVMGYKANKNDDVVGKLRVVPKCSPR